jgi:hypothetical protein
MKLYLRELPEPLIPFAHYSAFLAVQREAQGLAEWKARISERTLALPAANRRVLRYLFSFLNKVFCSLAPLRRRDSRSCALV